MKTPHCVAKSERERMLALMSIIYATTIHKINQQSATLPWAYYAAEYMHASVGLVKW